MVDAAQNVDSDFKYKQNFKFYLQLNRIKYKLSYTSCLPLGSYFKLPGTLFPLTAMMQVLMVAIPQGSCLKLNEAVDIR